MSTSFFELVSNVPSWAGTLLLSAATGVVVYWWKEWTAGIKRNRAERVRLIGQLQDLQSLLATSYGVAVIQQEKAIMLLGILEQNHPAEFALGGSYEEIMARCHPLFNEGEKELHGLIRAYSEHSMRRMNEALLKWVEQDKYFKSEQTESGRNTELSARLHEMEMHLLLWFAKFEFWIPNQPHHALVYMADEKQHGLGFPIDHEKEVDGIYIKVAGVDTEVTRVLEELRRKWK